MARFSLPMLTACATLLLSSTAIHAQSLKQAMEGAYQNNPSLLAARSSLAATDEGVASAMAGLRPSITGSATGSQTENFDTNTDSDSWSVSITASQTLYAGGQNLLGIAAADLEVMSVRQDLLDTEQLTLFSAVQAFMDVRRDADNVRLSQNNVRVLTEQLRAANDRFEVGEVTRTDVSQTEARLAAARSSLELSKGTLNVSRETYRATVGEYPTNPFSPTGLPNLPKSADVAEEVALANHPRILAAQFDLSAAEIGLDAAKRALQPTVTGSVSVQRSKSAGANDPLDSGTVSITGSVPIYQGGSLNSGIRSATATLNSARVVLQQQGLITRQSVRSAYANWQAAVAAITASQEQVRASRIAFEGVTEEASLGARTTLDVLDAEQELRNAESALIAAARDEVVARFSVLSEMGQLTAEKMGLDVALFNPEENYNSVNPSSKLGKRRDALLDKILERSGN